MKLDIKGSIPKKIDVLELFARDGIQDIDTYLPVESKVWFINEFIACGYKYVEVTNFSHPRFLVQSKDAEEVLAGLKRVEGDSLQDLRDDASRRQTRRGRPGEGTSRRLHGPHHLRGGPPREAQLRPDAG